MDEHRVADMIHDAIMDVREEFNEKIKKYKLHEALKEEVFVFTC